MQPSRKMSSSFDGRPVDRSAPALHLVPDTIADVIDDVANAEWSRQVRTAVSCLEPDSCAALRLVYFDRLTHRQAATRMGLTTHAFARIMATAMRELACAVTA